MKFQTGYIQYFCLEEWQTAVQYQHNEAIKSVHPNPDGMKCLFIDCKNEGHLYNPVIHHFLYIS